MTNTHGTNPSNNDDYDNNIALIYDYVEKSINTLRSNINDITSRLGLLIGFELTFIRFFMLDLPSLPLPNQVLDGNNFLPCYSCFVLKLLAYIFIITSIITCLWKGFIPGQIRLIIPYEVLLSQAKKGTTTQYKEAIITDIWKYSLEDARKILDIKSMALEQAIRLWIISMIFTGLDILLHYIFY